jgi:hypothetical protein
LDPWFPSTVAARVMPDLDTWRRARSVENRQKEVEPQFGKMLGHGNNRRS